MKVERKRYKSENDKCFDIYMCFIHIDTRKLCTLIDSIVFLLIANGSSRLAVSSQTVVTSDASQMINCCLVVTVNRCAILILFSGTNYNSAKTSVF